jgi:hypothetical protein
VYDLTTKVFSEITSDGWLGSSTVSQLGGYYSFIATALDQRQTFYNSAFEDAATLDAGEFATANNSPDRLIGQVRGNNQLFYFGEVSTEVWELNASESAVDSVFIRANTVLDVGLLAAHTAKILDNAPYFLGRDERGAGMVYRISGMRAERISTMAIEEKIQKAISDGEDVSQAVAYAYQQGGHSFYALNVPGVSTTWVYDAASHLWHERTDFELGEHIQHRAKYHAYCYGKHCVAGDDDVVYFYDIDANTNAGDPLVRERVSPHYATPTLDINAFRSFELDCTVGKGLPDGGEAQAMLRYSNDGGVSWSDWRHATLGSEGEHRARARWLRLGSARDRVWATRVTDDVQVAIINASIQ